MSRPTTRIQRRSSHFSSRGSSLVLAGLIALSTAVLPTGAAAADPFPHGPGTAQWDRHLQLEYGVPTDRFPHGPGSPTWTRHLELENGQATTPFPQGPGSPTWTRHLELEYGA